VKETRKTKGISGGEIPGKKRLKGKGRDRLRGGGGKRI